MDVGGEAFYLRDEESGRFWSPLGFPAQGDTPYTTHHGFGYTEIEHEQDGLQTTTTIHVDAESPIKFIRIKVTNRSGRARKVTVTGFCEWVLSDLRSKSLLHIVTELDTTTKALLTRNSFNSEFMNYVSFFEVDQENYTFTTDRTEFLGRNGTVAQPDAMTRLYLSGKSGAGTDPCTALRVERELSSGEEYTIVFKIGAAKDTAEAIQTILKFKKHGASLLSLEVIKDFWLKTLGAVTIETPDQALNFLANGWLPYQVISSRLWARSGFYQSGGAFGFRDQLQDVMALFNALPNLARTQILLCASRQFKEGDVQHWWHPPKGRGVRTRCSDDYLWLPYVTSRYISCTNDVQILEEQIPYLQGRALNAGEESHYDLHATSDTQGTLFEHCKRAILHGLRFGEHGLPLHGSGDWNDGMNQVGMEGKGESVWLAFFLYDVLKRFVPIALQHGDQQFARKCEFEAAKLKEKIHVHTWDDHWYLRAFFDDGTKLGSHQNSECKIDAISQSWSVLSNGGSTERAHVAMRSVDTLLVNREKGIIQLLDPPFDKSDVNPGYIKGYVPGVRENGGQYTHAAIWVVMAFAKMGDKKITEELLRLINPIYHGSTREEISIYKAEPYVIAADVYGISPHIGRGGWSWYTGSAGWMYQLIMEYFLGLQRTNRTLSFKPCIPVSWSSFSVNYLFKETRYHIRVDQQPNLGTPFVMVDGIHIEGTSIELNDDRVPHQVVVTTSS
jgi:cellobiose phosphorylase